MNKSSGKGSSDTGLGNVRDQALTQLCEQLDATPASSGLAHWQPVLSGDMPLRIDREGRWWHEGRVMERLSLVRLLSSVLRAEADGEHYLVTPQEKWRIHVDDAPVVLTQVERVPSPDGECVRFSAPELGFQQVLREPSQWQLRAFSTHDVPYLQLPHALWGRVASSAYYQLADWATEREGRIGLYSAGQWICLDRA